ncbi:MAG TPA: hypothetical protein EYP56_13660 [Planctomycetaceae bacterium]|nr:hypothetical protein [Planctomycetaceae bacterium]HIQ22597.1 hypothetical protein [Planctomycetota bacterium]
MRSTPLRVYYGPPEEEASVALSQAEHGEATVEVRLGDVLPILADAVVSRRAWLSDFDDDRVTISADLYEVILAYRHYRRPSA